MIDWWNVFTNALWIAGLAVALAFFSYADWSSSRRSEGVVAAAKSTVREPGFILGLAIACLGAGLGVVEWWRRILWFLLCAGLMLESGRIYLSRRKDPAS